MSTVWTLCLGPLDQEAHPSVGYVRQSRGRSCGLGLLRSLEVKRSECSWIECISDLVSLKIVDEVQIPNGFRESQVSYSMKSVVKQGDPAGTRSWMQESSLLDGLGDGAGAFQPSSHNSGYSVLSQFRVSQQLDGVSFGRFNGF